MPYFKRAETWKGNGDIDPARGTDGPLSVSPTRLKRSITEKWLDAAENAGYKRNPDYNGIDQEGVGYFQLTLDKGRRCSSAVAYLNPAKKRKNLTVITHAQAEKVLIKKFCAFGVTINQKGQSHDILARREVILSAGTIGSPQILMLSGIGAATELKKHGINMIKDLPGVGKNLQDHLQARPVFKTNLSTINTEINNVFKQGLIALQYALTQTGPMTMAASLGTAFLKTDPILESPDIQFHIQPWSASKPADGPHKFSAFTASVLQLRPESTGHLKLKSSDWREHPEIHPNYLATNLDQNTIVKGINLSLIHI